MLFKSQALSSDQSNRDDFNGLKLLLLAATFFLVIGSYTLVRELKSSIFMTVVGKEWVPWARLLVMIGLMPAVMFYSFLVDRLRRYQLLYFYSLFYGIIGLFFTFLVAHPIIGITNTDASPNRLFGWFFYFFIEGFSPFVVSVFWAFANSVYNPSEAKNNYAVIVTASKIGGMLTAAMAWFIFSCYTSGERLFSDVAGHQIILGVFSLLVLCVPILIRLLIVNVPGYALHGYEAVYQFEKEKKKEKKEKESVFSGLFLLLKWPYIFGIFGMLFFYEVVSTVLSYHRLSIAHDISKGDISGVSCFLFKVAFWQHALGIVISFLGTRTLLRLFGERVCLLLIPAVTMLLLIYFTFSYTPWSVIIGLMLLQAVNYAFAQPVRESLYIPTVKDIKFKSKSWIDAFGSRFAKGIGSAFNIIANKLGPALFFTSHSIFFGGVITLWIATAYLMGRRYAYAIKHNEVIGQDKQEIEEAEQSA